MLPLIYNSDTEWEDRYIFEHVTRWDRGVEPYKHKWKEYSVRSQRYRLVEGALFDMEQDPSQLNDISKDYPEVVAAMKSAYEEFWDEVRPMMINENVPLAKEVPYHKHYNEQRATTGIGEPPLLDPMLMRVC